MAAPAMTPSTAAAALIRWSTTVPLERCLASASQWRLNVAGDAFHVMGDASIGTDTLIHIESIRGTNFADTFNATGYNGASS